MYCCQAHAVLSHLYRFPTLHLPMRNSPQNSHHHLTLRESQRGPWEMLKWFPSHFLLNLMWTCNVLLQNAVETVYIISTIKLAVKFFIGQLAILIEEMIRNIKMGKASSINIVMDDTLCASNNKSTVLFSEGDLSSMCSGIIWFLFKLKYG